jgi:hypothetical protein
VFVRAVNYFKFDGRVHKAGLGQHKQVQMTRLFFRVQSYKHSSNFLSVILCNAYGMESFFSLVSEKINKNVFCVKIKIDEVGRYFVIVFPKVAAAAAITAVLVRTSVLLY